MPLRLADLERTRVSLMASVEAPTPPKSSYEGMFEQAMRFLAKPSNLWLSGIGEHQKLAVKLAFSDKLAYSRKDGFRTPKTTIPFNMLAGVDGSRKEMAVDVVHANPSPGHFSCYSRKHRISCAGLLQLRPATPGVRRVLGGFSNRSEQEKSAECQETILPFSSATPRSRLLARRFGEFVDLDAIKRSGTAFAL
ncbi:MAG: hypothetical protein ABIQ30_13465 [Devosia sp.]